MFKVLSCITTQHDLRLVIVAALICVMAALTAFRLFADAKARPRGARIFRVILASLVAGIGIWATHFVGMLAYAPAMNSGYEPVGTALSFLTPILGADEHKNGERWVRAERRRTRDGGLVTVVMDVTEFRWAQEVLAQARDTAEAANRAKSEFLANISHELRTPLNGVLGIAEVLTHTPLDERQLEMVETIRASGANLEALLSDIMDLARLESGNVDLTVEAFDLADAVRTAAAAYQLQARGKGLGFALDLSPDVKSAVAGDPARLRQILANLISNAVKFTDRP